MLSCSVIKFAIDNGWTSARYSEAMRRSVVTTQEYIQDEINPTCSIFNVEIYLSFTKMADGAVRAWFQDQWG